MKKKKNEFVARSQESDKNQNNKKSNLQDNLKNFLLVYNETGADIFEKENMDDLFPLLKKENVNWFHFNSLQSTDSIEKIGKYFNLHSLLLEDLVYIDLLPKVEYYSDHLLFTIKMLQIEKNKKIKYEQLSIVLGHNYLITIQETPGNFFTQAKERTFNQKGKVNKNGTDYLFYVLVDLVVDNYFNVMEFLREQLDEIEDLLVEYPDQNYIHRLHEIRKKIVTVRKYVFGLLESLQNLISDEPNQIEESNYNYLRDIKDHVQYNFVLVESFKEDQRSLVELNQSNQSNNMNQVMKTLTIVASIFIPLTFIVGVYGMNFHYMPELTWKWGYFGVMGFMAVVTVLMVWYMKRKKWF